MGHEPKSEQSSPGRRRMQAVLVYFGLAHPVGSERPEPARPPKPLAEMTPVRRRVQAVLVYFGLADDPSASPHAPSGERPPRPDWFYFLAPIIIGGGAGDQYGAPGWGLVVIAACVPQMLVELTKLRPTLELPTWLRASARALAGVAIGAAALWWLVGSTVGPVGSLLVVTAIYVLTKGASLLSRRRLVRDESRSASTR